jgi:quercetin dioxygenase-like cupin family protein
MEALCGPGSWVKSLAQPPAKRKSKAPGWESARLFHGATPCLPSLRCQVSTLAPGAVPHPPHTHGEEEVLVVLNGCLAVELYDPAPAATPAVVTVPPGSLIYYAANQRHTIRSAGDAAARYVVYKWEAPPRARADGALRTQKAQFWPLPLAEKRPGLRRARVLRGPTEQLDRFTVQVTELAPGAGYEPHRDDGHDVAIVVLEGIVETIGARVGAEHVIFYAAGDPHGMRNPGPAPARYLVVEFHNPARA